MMDTISIRYENVKDLESMGEVLKEKRSKLIRELLFEGRKIRAVELYRQKKLSLGLGAKFAGVSLSEFIDLLKMYNVKLNLECHVVHNLFPPPDLHPHLIEVHPALPEPPVCKYR